MLIVFLASCGPDTNALSLDEAGLTRVTLAKNARWSISGLETRRPNNLKASVIFIHGTPGSAETWIDMLSDTPPDIYAVALDRPGYGETTPKTQVTALREQARAVIDIARDLKERSIAGDPPIIIAGHSYGAPIAAQAAIDAPDLFHAAVLVAGALDPSLEEVHWAQRLGTWQPFKFLIGHTLRTANAELMTLEDELIVLQAKLPQAQTPIYILHGSADALVPIENVPYMQAHFDQSMLCKTIVIEGQNHFLPWNEKAAFWALISQAIAHESEQKC